MKKLLSIPSAMAFLVAVFMNAFVDLGHKIIIQNTLFKMYDGPEQVILTAIVNGLILLPFILLFVPAGRISDQHAKHKVMQVSAWAAVAITVVITACYYWGWFWMAFAMTFLLAVQSAFYSPAKYGYLKGFFGKAQLAQANGLVQAVSIVAILAGTVVFSLFFEMRFPQDAINNNQVLQMMVPLGFLLIANSIIELVMMYRLPNVDTHLSVQAPSSSAVQNSTTKPEAFSHVKSVIKNATVRLSIIGLAMFWSVGQVLLAAFPAFAKSSLGEVNTLVIQGILAATGVGIAIGSMVAGRLSKSYIETGLIPIGALGVAVGLLVLPTLDSAIALAINFLWIGMMGGLFIIPLNALIQYSSQDADLGKTLSVNNLLQNIAMLSFLFITVLFSLMGIASEQLILLMAVVALVGGVYTVYQLPQSLVRFVLGFLMQCRYNVTVQGMKNIPEKGGVLLLGNHVSFVDWAIVQIACPRPVHFVMQKSIYERWYLRRFLNLCGCIPIEAGVSSKKSLDTVAKMLEEGKVVCLFPEGLLSRTGHLAEFRKGYERATEQASSSKEQPIVIVPFYLNGLWGSQFSRSSSHLKTMRSSGLSRDVIAAFGAPLPKNTPANKVKQRIFDVSVHSWNEYVQTLATIPEVWINTVKRQKTDFSIVDSLSAGGKKTALSASKVLAAATAFSRRIQRNSSEQNIGLLVPTSAGGVIANMACLLAGKTVVNLNYTASTASLNAAVEQAEIKTIYTSKRFVKKLADKGMAVSEFLNGDVLHKVNIVYLEDIKATISSTEMLARWFSVVCLPANILRLLFVKKLSIKKWFVKKEKSNTTAAILFSSGSEGQPKGVKLSHHNILANVKQVADVLNTQADDRVMASLPLFHAFGLTVTQFMPLLEGLPMVCHPDPTDVVNAAKAIATYRVTVMCGTSTFLRLYCRNHKVHPLMLESLRVVVSGAEKLNAKVRDDFTMKFSKKIYEGYGATETSPVASVNLPDAMDSTNYRVQKGGKIGTVGMPLPGTSFKVVDPNTYEELPTGSDGMILIGGVQVMQGYLNNDEKTQQAIREIDGIRWYITGDKGHVDEDGYLTIVDRYSRFAKVGGEMISLSEVETTVVDALLQSGAEERDVIAANIPDDKKGETIILVVDKPLELSALRQALLEYGCNPLLIPSDVVTLAVLPTLGSGKVDFTQAKQQVVQRLVPQEVIQEAQQKAQQKITNAGGEL